MSRCQPKPRASTHFKIFQVTKKLRGPHIEVPNPLQVPQTNIFTFQLALEGEGGGRCYPLAILKGRGDTLPFVTLLRITMPT
eukprot:6482951-Amphidinium_carterae.2